jgi:HNH endonuclease
MAPPAKITRYRTVKAVGHPLAQADGKAYAHRVVLYGKIGPGVHACHWCGREVEWSAAGIRRLVADHLDEDRWHNAPENLVPACRRCNSERSKRADFLTHCNKGHEYIPKNTYERPDGLGRQCRVCNADRDARRQRRVRPRMMPDAA